MGRPVLVLPEETQLELRRLAGMDEPRMLDSFLRKIADMGWGYQPSATALGLTRQSVYERALRGSETLYQLPEVQEARPPRPEPPALTQAEREHLLALHQAAVQLKGHHPLDDFRRVASEQLSALIDELKSRKITYLEIGDAMGVKPMTVRARLRRHGYRTTEPSLTPYRAAAREKENAV